MRLMWADPEPAVSTVVADAIGRWWVHMLQGCWVRVDDPDGPPQPWREVSGIFWPVREAVPAYRAHSGPGPGVGANRGTR